MPLTIRTKIRSGYIIAFLLLLTSYLLLFYVMRELNRGTQSITHSYAIVNALKSLRTDLIEAETGVRGYILTKEEKFLLPYYKTKRFISENFKELKHLNSKDSKRGMEIQELENDADLRLNYLNDMLENFHANGLRMTDFIAERVESGKVIMDGFRTRIYAMEAQENAFIKNRSGNIRGFFSMINIIAAISLLLMILTIVFALVTYNKENTAKQNADNKVMEYQQELESKIKELEQVNRELRELKQIEKFAATGRIARTIAHEVRNPLTNITLAAEQLSENREGKEADLMLEMITRNATRINQLVSDLLNSTRFAQLEFIKMDLNTLIDETIKMAEDRIDLKHIKLLTEYAPEPCTVLVDPEKMKLAFLNIIVNAIEAMQDGSGELVIKTFPENDKIFIEISDNGKGMDEETLQKVFEPYFTAKAGGTGLGLTNSQNIIFNHKGRIFVSSNGNGSIFTVELDQA